VPAAWATSTARAVRVGADRPQPAPHRARRHLHAGCDPAVPGAVSRGQQGRADDLDVVAAPGHTPRRQQHLGHRAASTAGAVGSQHDQRTVAPADPPGARSRPDPKDPVAAPLRAAQQARAQRAASGSTTVITKARSRQHSRSLPAGPPRREGGNWCCSIPAPPGAQQPLRPNGSVAPARTSCTRFHRDPRDAIGHAAVRRHRGVAHQRPTRVPASAANVGSRRRARPRPTWRPTSTTTRSRWVIGRPPGPWRNSAITARVCGASTSHSASVMSEGYRGARWAHTQPATGHVAFSAEAG
jgi:hypothetical protein